MDSTVPGTLSTASLIFFTLPTTPTTIVGCFMVPRKMRLPSALSVRPEAASESFVDDASQWRSLVIAIGKRPAAQERNAHGLKKRGTDALDREYGALSQRDFGVTFGQERRIPRWTQRKSGRNRGGTHARQNGRLRQQAIEKAR